MNAEPVRQRASLAYMIGIVGAFLIVAFLVWAMRKYTQPEPLGQKRAVERAKALSDLRASDAYDLSHVAWINQSNGIVRLRIEDAMNLVERAWQNPPAARSNL